MTKQIKGIRINSDSMQKITSKETPMINILRGMRENLIFKKQEQAMINNE